MRLCSAGECCHGAQPCGCMALEQLVSLVYFQCVSSEALGDCLCSVLSPRAISAGSAPNWIAIYRYSFSVHPRQPLSASLLQSHWGLWCIRGAVPAALQLLSRPANTPITEPSISSEIRVFCEAACLDSFGEFFTSVRKASLLEFSLPFPEASSETFY